MPLQMAGPDANLSLAAGMGVLDRSSGSLGSVSYSFGPSSLCSDIRFALYAALQGTSVMCVCTNKYNTLSSIQPGLTWHRVGGVWVHIFQDHYACCVAAILPGA